MWYWGGDESKTSDVRISGLLNIVRLDSLIEIGACSRFRTPHCFIFPGCCPSCLTLYCVAIWSLTVSGGYRFPLFLKFYRFTDVYLKIYLAIIWILFMATKVNWFA